MKTRKELSGSVNDPPTFTPHFTNHTRIGRRQPCCSPLGVYFVRIGNVIVIPSDGYCSAIDVLNAAAALRRRFPECELKFTVEF